MIWVVCEVNGMNGMYRNMHKCEFINNWVPPIMPLLLEICLKHNEHSYGLIALAIYIIQQKSSYYIYLFFLISHSGLFFHLILEKFPADCKQKFNKEETIKKNIEGTVNK